ncbi:sigma-70 family RNA polymerase sigma factor [Planctomycetota bacterium]
MQANPEVIQNMKLANKIFEEYGDIIRDIIRFQINDKSMVDDIFQNFFLSLVRCPISDEIGNIKKYLHRAIKNDIIDASLRIKNYHARNQKYGKLYINYANYNNPIDVVIQKEERQILLDFVQSLLRPHEAEVIIRRYIYNQKNSDAAKEMGVKTMTFSRYICTALKKIREYLSKTNSEPDVFLPIKVPKTL